MFRLKTFLVCAIVASLLLFGSLLTTGLADGGGNHRGRNLNLGVSGGNVNDISRRFCCSGTLGALITDGTNQYILSNNHVLGRSGEAVAGEDVSQPGMIDNNCNIATVVADFTGFAPLGPSNVDAAVAQLRPGQMNGNGAIEDIGVPSSTIVNPSVGLSVAKSGRTTGFTTGSITSINTSVSVAYSAQCGGGGKRTTVTFTNQIVITPGTFSAGGDSGSLIVTNNSSHNPVGLLFAGSSSSTIANPIGQVLQRLGAALGRTFSFGGGGGGSASTTSEQDSRGRRPFTPGVENLMRSLPEQASDRALNVLEQHRAVLMATPGIIGAGIGASGRADGEAAIIIFVNKDAGQRPFVPESIDGIPVTVILTDEFVAR